MTLKVLRETACAFVSGIAVMCAASEVLAQTHEAVLEQCRESVGRPFMQACMGGRKDMRESCRAQASPKVRACVIAAEQKIAAKKGAPAAPATAEVVPSSEIRTVPTAFVAPPRSIADITAILDQEKPDPARIAKAQAAADVPPPAGLSVEKLVQFYYERAAARGALARNADALADAQKAREIGEQRGAPARQLTRVIQMLALEHQALGDPKKAVEALKVTVAVGEQAGRRGALISAARSVANLLVQTGDVAQAEAYVQRVIARVQEARGSPHPTFREAYARYGNSWEADSDEARALVFEARGQYREAEASYRRAEAFRRRSIADLPKFEYPVPISQAQTSAEHNVRALARVKAKQGRLAEAEADARKALLAILKINGKYHPQTRTFMTELASILVDQGRYEDAEKIMRAAVEVLQTLGVAEDSQNNVSTLAQLASVLILERKDKEALEIYGQIEQAVAKWEPQRREVFLVSSARTAAFYAAGRIEEGIATAQAMVKRATGRNADNHSDAATARGMLAMGYAMAKRDADAVREFKASLPVLIAASRENANDDDSSVTARRTRMLQNVAESYIALLARGGDPSGESAIETFALADAIRSRSVQQALAASSARMVVKDPALSDLVRTEQDLSKQVNAQLGTLNNALSLPPAERDEAGIRNLNAAIALLRADRDKARADINKRFPSYADLVDPKPPTVQQIKAALKPGEALLSFYLGRASSFVWAVPKEGSPAFAAIPAKALDIEAKVRRLREALEPQAAMISDIPSFDLALGYDLYATLLKPVEAGWKSATSLVVVTNGALGLLPLSVLPTAPAEPKDGGPMFAGYQSVPWLARTHAVTMIPSAAALMTLRALPAGPAGRAPLVGFGDPYFSEKQAVEAAAEEKILLASADANVMRGVPLQRRSSPQTQGVDSAELALLPRLPDTADELRSIAAALEADPVKALYLGKMANEKNVKSVDLSGFKTVAFATHGLVPGDLNGLAQPALALTAPQIADIDGDGLLTMEEILALKLDADWVILSACNTGTGAGAGAEAASGLGRAFFYAGTRAILVTNWSVHSQSARELVSDLFRRQAADSKLGRSEALRQAMIGVIDGKGFADEKGATVFSYAHPLFWAPYSIIGDGG